MNCKDSASQTVEPVSVGEEISSLQRNAERQGRQNVIIYVVHSSIWPLMTKNTGNDFKSHLKKASQIVNSTIPTSQG